MRAAKWKLDDAKKRIAGTLEWRRHYKPELIPPDEVRIESETGKMFEILHLGCIPRHSPSFAESSMVLTLMDDPLL